MPHNCPIDGEAMKTIGESVIVRKKDGTVGVIVQCPKCQFVQHFSE